MKQGWTYKRLGEVCVDKKQIVRASNLFLPNEIINYIDISSIDNSQNVITSTTPIIFDDAPSRAQQVVKIGDVLISLVRPNLRNVAIVNSQNDNLVASSGFCILRTEGHVNNRYIFYIVKGDKFTNYLLSRVQGANYPAVREDDIKNYLLPVPPLAEQERIVAELDLLSGIIEKKKAQLKAYDQLAQSIFYTTFGDPITNEKGWEVKKLGEICENCDSMRKPITAKDREQGEIPYYGASGIVDYVKDYIFDGDYLLISEDGANLIARSTPIAFSIKGKTWVNNHAHVLKFTNQITQQYVEFSINLRDVSAIVTGCAQPKLTQANLNRILISFPPLSLQREFAEKVEAIERQKALVQQSIEETQTLFDYTMDKYFG